MILLPRGNPVKENLDPGKFNLPEALGKLQGGGFSGYLRFEVPSGTGILIFERGRLISALFQQEEKKYVALQALALIFTDSLRGGARLDIYRLSPDLAISIHALLHGTIVYQGQEIKLIDIKALLGSLRDDQVSGCLRIYTKERIALIFYRQGQPLGFFHDGSVDIEKTADTSLSVAKLPGAKIDLLASSDSGQLEVTDLLRSLGVAEIWEEARLQVVNERRITDELVARQRELQERARRESLLLSLRTVAERHLGRIGASMVDKEFEKIIASGQALQEADWKGTFEKLGKAAKLVAGPQKVQAMLEEMREGVNTLLKKQ